MNWSAVSLALLLGVSLGLLAFFPLILLGVFYRTLYDRMKRGILEDLTKHKAFEIDVIKDRRGDAAGVGEEIETTYRTRNFLIPASPLTLTYGMGFVLTGVVFDHQFNDNPISFSADKIAEVAPPFVMAFLSVYLFNMGAALRRLYLSDLTEYVYWNALLRTLVASGLALLIYTLPDLGSAKYLAYFALGFVPTDVLREMVDRGLRLIHVQSGPVENTSLNLIDGVNFWTQYRLEEEGIENVQNLATCDLIGLAIKTRYNLRTLIDWVDQAILLNRFGPAAATLRRKGLISGAIDLAWMSSLADAEDTAERLAKVLKSDYDPHLIKLLMDSLNQDTQVRTLWQLWQSDLHAGEAGHG